MGIGDMVADVPGLLRPEDEEKLYELGSEADGPILEIGTYRGRSTTIMALGAQAGAGALLVSVDVDPAAQRAATAALLAHGVAQCQAAACCCSTTSPIRATRTRPCARSG